LSQKATHPPGGRRDAFDDPLTPTLSRKRKGKYFLSFSPLPDMLGSTLTPVVKIVQKIG